MPRLCKVDRKVDDNASTTSSTSGLSRADRLANRQRTIQAAAQALIDVKNPTVVSSPLSAGGSPPVRRRGRSSRLSNVNEEDDESDDGDDDAHVNDDNDDQSDDDSDDDNQSDDEDNDNKNAEHAGENPYLAYRASKIARNESKLRALGLAVPSHAPSVTAAEEDKVDDTIDSIDNDRKTRRLNYAKMKAANTKASPLKNPTIDCDVYSGDQCAHIRLMEIVEKHPLEVGHTFEQKETMMIRIAEEANLRNIKTSIARSCTLRYVVAGENFYVSASNTAQGVADSCNVLPRSS